jgi:hypothetical protein
VQHDACDGDEHDGDQRDRLAGEEDVTIQMDVAGAGTTIVSWGTINWPIDMASGNGDSVTIDGSDLTTDDLDIALGASGIDSTTTTIST